MSIVEQAFGLQRRFSNRRSLYVLDRQSESKCRHECRHGSSGEPLHPAEHPDPGKASDVAQWGRQSWRRAGLLAGFLIATLHAQQPLPPEAAGFAQHAVALQQSGDYAGAADAYRAVLRLEPNDVATHVNLGVVLAKMNRFDEALAEYSAAEKLLPGDPRIELNIALAYQKSGRIREAAAELEKVHAQTPENKQATLLLADSYLQLGENQKLTDLLRPLAAPAPDDAAVAYMLGVAELRLGDYPAAVRDLATAAQRNPQLPQVQSLYGRALLNTGDPDAAQQAFRGELKQNPNDFDANAALGAILAQRDDCKAAMPLLQRAIALRAEAGEAQLGLSQCLALRGNYADALPHAQAALRAYPQSAEAHGLMSKIQSGLHNMAAAAREQTIAETLRRKTEDPPHIGDIAPDFELPTAVTGDPVRLSQYRDTNPVVLVFGSYSCPNLRSAAEVLRSAYQRYHDRVAFLLVYIREAHTAEQWQSTRNEREGIAVHEPSTITEREQNAIACNRRLHLPFPALADTLDGKVEAEYHAWPSRALVIDKLGRVQYSTHLTELDFHAPDFDQAIKTALQSHERGAGSQPAAGLQTRLGAPAPALQSHERSDWTARVPR